MSDDLEVRELSVWTSRVVLKIGRSSSQCGACGGDADPNEKSHVAPCGYMQNPGCGAIYTHVASSYMGKSCEEATQKMRPDLEYVGVL